ncbi:MAG: hypothetical protein K2I49_01260 [Ureaplasma sp.]|nr:hypothetical protein [Ureaplasma sp.]
MTLDKKRLNYILTLSIISIVLFILGIILISTSFRISTITSWDGTNHNNINIVSIVFGSIFTCSYIVIILVLVVKTMTQNWECKWCLKYNVAFAILGLFFGWLIFVYFAGIGKVKFNQEFNLVKESKFKKELEIISEIRKNEKENYFKNASVIDYCVNSTMIEAPFKYLLSKRYF